MGSRRFIWSSGLFAAFVILTAGCWAAPSALVRLGSAGPSAKASGLSACTPATREPFELDPNRPLMVLVHGCNFSMGSFRTLAELIEAHDQQTICFNYDDRGSIDEASRQLAAALKVLEGFAPGQEITVLGHSQGGLVARHALSASRDPSFAALFHYRLVTVSAPFSGINTSKNCGLPLLHIGSLGLTVLVCQIIAGNKWTEIFPGSEFIRNPGTLAHGVGLHVRIATDERGGCARRNPAGECVKRDEVFTIGEQLNDTIDGEPRVERVEIRSGHSEIIGEWGAPPTRLLAVLQSLKILSQISPERRDHIAALMMKHYGAAR